MTVKKKIILSVSLVLAAVLIVLWHNSLPIQLAARGLSADPGDVVASGLDANGSEYRVVACVRGDGSPAAAYCLRGFGGVWTIPAVGEAQDDGLAVVAWTDAIPYSLGEAGASPVFLEPHLVYAGNGAQQLIAIAREELPEGVSVRIRQDGAAFSLHLTAQAGSPENALNGLDIGGLLREKGVLP